MRPQTVVLREVKAARPNPRADCIALTVLVAMHVAFWWRALALRGFLLTGDISYQFEPFKTYLHEALRAGRLALWTPYLFAGYPIGAEGQIATFYPPSLLFSWLFSGGGASSWMLFFHLVLAGASCYLLARALGTSPFGSWAGAVVFSFSGYLFAHLHHVGLVSTAAWLPVVILFSERAWRGTLLPNAAGAALAWAMAATAGHPQTLFHISLVVLFWVAWRALNAKREDHADRMGPTGRLKPAVPEASGRPKPAVPEASGRLKPAVPGAGWRALWLLATVFALGAGLAAVQLLLTGDLSATAPHGDRGSLAYVTEFSLLPKHLFGLVSPNWQGSPASGDYRGERYYWEYVLYLGLLPLLLAVIGGSVQRGRTLAGLGAGALVLAMANGNPLWEALRIVPGFADFRVPARFILVFTFAAALLVGIGWDTVAGGRWLRRGRRPYVVAGIVAILLVVDLGNFDRSFLTLTSRTAYQALQPVAEAVQREKEWGRVLVIPPVSFKADWIPEGGSRKNPDGWAEPRMLLAADAPQSYRIPSVYGYVGFPDPGYEGFFAAVGMQLMQGRPDLASLLGVRHFFVTDPRFSMPPLPRTRIGNAWLYDNAGAFPRAFVVGEVVPADSAEGALQQVLALAEQGALHRAAVTQGELGGLRPEPGPVAKATVRDPRPEHLVVRASTDREALLVLNERWDRGWQARCDGRPAPLVRADSVLMGTPLPKGTHTLEFVYRPRGLVIGRAISLVSLGVWAALMGVGLWRRSPSRAAQG